MEATSGLTPFEGQIEALCPAFHALFAYHNEAVALYAVDRTLLVHNNVAADMQRSTRFEDVREGTFAREAVSEVLKGVPSAYEAHIRSNEGSMHLRVEMTPIILDGQVRGFLEIARELRLAIQTEDGIDQVTGLPSPIVLHDRISRLLLQMRRDSRSFALHLFSVATEQFDDDEMLNELHRITATRLTAALRRVDTVARLGRAFVVVQPDVSDMAGTTRLIERLVDELREPMAWQGKLHIPIVRVGSAFATRNTASVEELFVEADLALARVRGSRILGPTLRTSDNG